MLMYMCNLIHVDREAVELMNTNCLKEVEQFITDNFAGDEDYAKDHFSMDVACPMATRTIHSSSETLNKVISIKDY